MVESKTKKDLKKNDRNPFENNVQKPNPFKVPENPINNSATPRLTKKAISDLMTVRVNKKQHSQLKSYAVKSGYLLKELYEVAVFEFSEENNPIITQFDNDTTTVKISKDLYLKLRDIKYETQHTQSDIFSSAIEYYLKKNKLKGDQK